MNAVLAPAHHAARWWVARDDNRIECQLCPRFCKLRDGQRGFCFMRQRVGDHIELTAFGLTSGLNVDPIEKKPLFQFFPGTGALSFGTIGCNLGCRFCQNWDISKSEIVGRLNQPAKPDQIAALAKNAGCRSVAFTYNDPVPFAEYAIETARAVHAAGLHTIAVTAGYISPEPRAAFFHAMDAANIDLKAFSDAFYRRLCVAHLEPVLETLVYLHRHTSVWLEVTTLLIPGENDSADELDRMTDWFAAELGPDVPWHFTAYHPDYKLSAPPTPLLTVRRARELAISKGIRHVYTGNVSDVIGSSTWCPTCGKLLIARHGYRVRFHNLERGCCRACGTPVPGHFESMAGHWEGRCEPVHFE